MDFYVSKEHLVFIECFGICELLYQGYGERPITMRTAYPLDSHTIDLHKHHDYFLLYVAFHTNKADVMNLVIYHQNITFDDL